MFRTGKKEPNLKLILINGQIPSDFPVKDEFHDQS